MKEKEFIAADGAGRGAAGGAGRGAAGGAGRGAAGGAGMAAFDGAPAEKITVYSNDYPAALK